MVDVPSAQERVTAKATPAEAMAWTKADSLVAETETEGQSVEVQHLVRGLQAAAHYFNTGIFYLDIFYLITTKGVPHRIPLHI